MTDRIKVLQLQVEYNVSESDLHEEIIKALPPEKYEVTSVFLHGRPRPGTRDLHPGSEHTVYFDMRKSSLSGLRLKALWRIWRFCRQQRFDVVITHLFKPMHIMLQLNRWLRIPRCIAVVHAFNNFDRHYRQRCIQQMADHHWRFVAVSEALRQHLVELDCGFTPDNVVTITNALDVQQTESGLMPREKARNELKLENDALVFGTIGRLVRVKGQKHLINAFARLRSQYPAAKLVIVGGGNLEDELRQQIRALDLVDSVLLAGEISGAYRLIPAFDCFVLSSLSEAMPLVLLEAMICRTPIIATRVGGISSMLDGIPDSMVEPADEEGLYQAMQQFARQQASQRKSTGEQLYQRVLERYTVQTYRENYRKLISGQQL